MPSEKRLRDLLVGEKVIGARITEDAPPDSWASGPTGYLTLSNGLTLTVWGNDGGCACSAGCYPLSELNACDNIITNVEIDEHPSGDGFEENEEEDEGGYYRIFVYAENRRIRLASFDGSDENGYYGTGWWLAVSEETG